MRVHIYIITLLVSLIAWGMLLDGARATYRVAWHDRLIPNLKLHDHLERFISDFTRLA